MTIGRDEISQAQKTLEEYKAAKRNLEQRIIDNEQWFKLRHWDAGSGRTASAWLFNSIANKHADAMDNYPTVTCLPREESDKKSAETLSDILPVILRQNDFERVYSDAWWYKLKAGTACYGVFWDSARQNGLGDIAVRKVDLLNVYWESGVSDIQHSRNVFTVELQANDALEGRYPQLKGKLGAPNINISKYIYDDNVDTSDKSVVVDWYYKRSVGGREVLHYCKFCNGEVLFASENEEEYAQRGYYDHGRYPFVLDPLFVAEGTPAGFGFIDVMQGAQAEIDVLNEAIIKYSKMAVSPRYFVNSAGSVNEEEFANWENPFVHVNGSNLGDDSLRQIKLNTLPDVYVAMLSNKVEELKETSGNRDFSQGGTSAGVTAASAIAALQEAGGKISRDMIKSSYRAFQLICETAIELIRQFYDAPRCFRVVAPNGGDAFITYDNSSIKPQTQGNVFGVDLGSRLPIFDIDVCAEKSSAYSRLSQNELALQFYGLGFFSPQNSDAAIATLEMMEFNAKQSIVNKITQNGTMYQQIMQLTETVNKLSAIVDAQNGTSIQAAFGAENVQSEPQGGGGAVSLQSDNSLAAQARSTARETAQPR